MGKQEAHEPTSEILSQTDLANQNWLWVSQVPLFQCRWAQLLHQVRQGCSWLGKSMGKVDNIESESGFVCMDSMHFGVSKGLIIGTFKTIYCKPFAALKSRQKCTETCCSELFRIYVERHLQDLGKSAIGFSIVSCEISILDRFGFKFQNHQCSDVLKIFMLIFHSSLNTLLLPLLLLLDESLVRIPQWMKQLLLWAWKKPFMMFSHFVQWCNSKSYSVYFKHGNFRGICTSKDMHTIW